MYNNKVIIIVPLYKNYLSVVEQISLKQLFLILGKYDICFIVPDSLRHYLIEKYPGVRVEGFCDSFFTDIYSYSALLLEQSFYKRFLEYEFMLIYQTDAFVFEDRLIVFIDEGYDLIAAPVAKEYWPELNLRIGNGGFTLRKIQTMFDFVINKERVIQIWHKAHPLDNPISIEQYEDKYFAYCMELKYNSVTAPTLERAFEFSIDFNINGVFCGLERHIPFGCHRWSKYKFKEWWGIIEQYGYVLTEFQKNELISQDYNYNKRILIGKICSRGIEDIVLSAMRNEITSNGSVVLWGYGETGKEAEKVLDILNIQIEMIIDSNPTSIKVSYPLPQILSNICSPIIVCSKKYSKEIIQKIRKIGIGKRVITWDEAMLNWINKLKIDEIGSTQV